MVPESENCGSAYERVTDRPTNQPTNRRTLPANSYRGALSHLKRDRLIPTPKIAMKIRPVPPCGDCMLKKSAAKQKKCFVTCSCSMTFPRENDHHSSSQSLKSLFLLCLLLMLLLLLFFLLILLFPCFFFFSFDFLDASTRRSVSWSVGRPVYP